MVFQDARILCICWVFFFLLLSVISVHHRYERDFSVCFLLFHGSFSMHSYMYVCMYKPVVPSRCTLKNGLVFARLKSVVVTVTVFAQIIPRLNHWKNLQVAESFVTVRHHRVAGSSVCPSHRALFPFIWGWQSNSSLPKTDTFLRKGLSGVTARQLRRPS